MKHLSQSSEKKKIVATIIIAVTIAIALITLFLIFIKNSPNNIGSAPIDSPSLEDDNNISHDHSQNDSSVSDAIRLDPLYKYIGDEYESDNYTLQLATSTYTEDIMVFMTVNTSKPSTPQGEATIEKYKSEALQKIRSWNIDPNNYKLVVDYKYKDYQPVV